MFLDLRYLFLSIAFCLVILPLSPGMSEFLPYGREYEQEQNVLRLLDQLEFGTNQQKAHASYLLEGYGARFLRPLCRVLIKGIENKKVYKKIYNKINDEAFTMATIAYNIGKIAHPSSLSCLERALASSVAISIEEINKAKTQKSIQNFREENVELSPVLPDRAGPYLSSTEAIVYNADKNWSVSDSFKSNIDLFSYSSKTKDSVDKITFSQNWINVVVSILNALAFINDTRAVDIVKKYLDRNVTPESIRVQVILALGALGGDRALEVIKKTYNEQETFRVKVACSIYLLKEDRNDREAFLGLTKILKYGNTEERMLVAKAFLDIKMAQALPFLRQALEMEDNESIRGYLSRAIYDSEIDEIVSKYE